MIHFLRLSVLCVCLIAAVQAQQLADLLPAERAGLLVHLGASADTTVALAEVWSGQMQALVAGTDQAHVQQAVQAAGLQERVSIRPQTGNSLPYVDGLINVLIVDDEAGVDEVEWMRVLRPLGIFIDRRQATLQRREKAWPAGMGEWTHYLHEADNNAVSPDRLIAPLQGVQWVGGPRWSRFEGFTSSWNALVSARGRLFYVLEEAPRASFFFPDQHVLVAQDAFNGSVLWKKPIADWYSSHRGKKDTPAIVSRRIVARDDRVYATLGRQAPVSVLDAASGEEIETLVDTAGAEEILVREGRAYVVCGGDSGRRGLWERTIDKAQQRDLRVIDLVTNKTLWHYQSPLIELSLAVDDEQVYFHDGTAIRALRITDGSEAWISPPAPVAAQFPMWYAVTLVVQDGVVLFSGGKGKKIGHIGEYPPRNDKDFASFQDVIMACSAADGSVLWTAPHPETGYRSPEDILVVDGKVWFGPTTGGRSSYRISGRDLHSGEVAVTYDPWADFVTFENHYHHRCYRAKATVHHLLLSRRGMEFLKVDDGSWSVINWVRGPCDYGVLPANGMIYFGSHACMCYSNAQLKGFYALHGRQNQVRPAATVTPPERGPQADAVIDAGAAGPADWPTYRADARRRGSNQATISDQPSQAWQQHFAGPLTAPVASGDLVVVGEPGQRAVHGLAAADGSRRWSYTAAGGIDSPPTLAEGRVVFGTRGGEVVCLRGRDGALLWRQRPVPDATQLMDNGRLESLWPVHGAVLILDRLVYALAGRHAGVDGGLRLVAYDLQDGSLVHSLDYTTDLLGSPASTDHRSYLDIQSLPDLLTSDGEHIYLGTQTLTRELSLQNGRPPRLMTSSGFLDGSYFSRNTMTIGSRMNYMDSKNINARLLIADDTSWYGYSRLGPNTSPARDYRLHGTPLDAKPVQATYKKRPVQVLPATWEQPADLIIRAMAKGRDRLLVAGVPDLIEEESKDPGYDKMAHGMEALAAWRGERGAVLRIHDATEGRLISELELNARPSWDSLILARDAIFICTDDGALTCYR